MIRPKVATSYKLMLMYYFNLKNLGWITFLKHPTLIFSIRKIMLKGRRSSYRALNNCRTPVITYCTSHHQRLASIYSLFQISKFSFQQLEDRDWWDSFEHQENGGCSVSSSLSMEWLTKIISALAYFTMTHRALCYTAAALPPSALCM